MVIKFPEDMPVIFYRTFQTVTQVVENAIAYLINLAKHLQRDRPKQFAIVSSTVVLLLSLIWVQYFRQRGYKFKNSSDDMILKTRKALEALLVILTPTKSRWPSTYISIAETAAASNSLLALPISELIQDLNNGKLEVRNPNMLHELFEADPLRTYGWTIRLHIDTAWRMDVTALLVRKRQRTLSCYQSAPLKCAYMRQNSNDGDIVSHIENNIGKSGFRLTKNSHIKALSLTDSFLIDDSDPFNLVIRDGESGLNLTATRFQAKDAAPTLKIDFLPFAHLGTFLRATKSALQPGGLLAIEFTGLSSSVSYLGDSFMLCAYPFLPCRSQRSRLSGNQDYSVTPLKLSLSNVLDEINSGSNPLIIQGIHNISGLAARQIHDHLQEIDADPTLRANIIERIGMESWREMKLKWNWRAGLLVAGKLENWMIIVRRHIA